MSFDPNTQRDAILKNHERWANTEPEYTEQPEYIDEWEKQEIDLIRTIYRNTVDDGYYKGGQG